MVGKTLGHYRITAKIGTGGMGEVYRAHDEHLNREVAVKVLPSGALSDEQARKRFRREAETLSKLNHPHIATVHDFDTQDGVDFLVMEYVPGETLKEKLSGGPLPEKAVTRLGLQIAEALEAAHEKGVIHRDLKPGNIALSERGDAKVLDFGIAKLLRSKEELAEAATVDTLTKTAGLAGTLPYMSPEQLLQEEVDGRSDIYALGVVLYEMVTGQRPFDEKQYTAMTDAILHQPPPPLGSLKHDLSARLEDLILKCLEKNPANRYQSAKELAMDLRQVETPITTSAGGSALWGWRAGGVAVAVIALLAVLVGTNLGGVRDRLLGSGAAPQITSIAVLPLDNMMGDAEQDYFVAGMHDALITELSKISALTVISRPSTLGYKDTDKSIPEIARELGVDAVIGGSVLRAEDTVRITVQLIDGRTDRNLWADNFDRELKDILTLYSDVARAIAREIRITVTPEEETRLATARSVNPEAYEAYLKGWFYWYKLTPESLEIALQYFELALEKDPNYALAYVGIAVIWGTRGHLGLVPPWEAFPKTKAAVLKAIELDDTLGEAHEVLANVRFYLEWDWPAAEREYRRAIELNPNYAEARRTYSLFLASTGRRKEAMAEIQRALELDPHNSLFQHNVGMRLLELGRYDAAIAQYQKVLRTDPNFAFAHSGLWRAFHQKRMYEEALAEAKKFFALRGDSEVAEALESGYAQGGYAGAMRLAAEKRAARSKLTYVQPTQVAHLYAYAGEKDRALDWLEKAYQERNSQLVYINVAVQWDNLRDDPRFQDLLRRMNFPEN